MRAVHAVEMVIVAPELTQEPRHERVLVPVVDEPQVAVASLKPLEHAVEVHR